MPLLSASDQTTRRRLTNIETLFDYKRIESFTDLFLILLYSPLGLCLFIIRFFIFLYVLIVSCILSNKSPLKRSLFFVLGISVEADDEEFSLRKSKQPNFFISNHISDFDPLVLNLVFPCVYVSQRNFPCYINWLCHKVNEDDEKAYETAMKHVPLVCFPEHSKSNGKNGLFRFAIGLFHHITTVHLILLQAERPFFNINVSPLGSHWIADLFWLMFLPITTFKVKHLGSVSKHENETYEEFVKRVQLEMATKAKLKPSDFSVYDKKEFLKRLNTETEYRNALLQNDTTKFAPSSSQIEDFSLKIKEILPQVPLNVIQDDVAITNNIDDTIERILCGTVKYKPEVISAKNSADGSSASFSGSNERGKESPLAAGGVAATASAATAAKTFGKTSTERVASFQERKKQMFRMARIRYIQKFGIIQPANDVVELGDKK